MKRCCYVFCFSCVFSFAGLCIADEPEPTIIDGTEFIEGDTLEEKKEPVEEDVKVDVVPQQEYIPSLPSGRIPRQPLPRNRIERNPLPRQSIPRVKLPENKIPRESLPRNRVPRRSLERKQIERNPLPRNRIPRNPLPRQGIRDERREWQEELKRENKQ